MLGVTLSAEQLEAARERARERRACTMRSASRSRTTATSKGSFDRIVSVGMFEHVGTRFYDTYFGKCRELLKPDGVMLVHTIGLMDGPWYPNPWLDKYIFPGGQLPALSEIVPAIERAGLIVTDVECLRLHYAETLRALAPAFMARPRRGSRALRRALLPDVGVLSLRAAKRRSASRTWPSSRSSAPAGRKRCR